jgi:hypothetical protein
MWDEMVKKDVAKTERYAAGITRHAAIDLQHGAYHSQGMYIHMCAEDLLVHLRTEGYMETRFLFVCDTTGPKYAMIGRHTGLVDTKGG